MPAFPEIEHQLDVIRRGVVDLIKIDELRVRLEKSRASGTPLRVKLGIDPTSPDVHLGHTVIIRKLKDFQDLGHQVVLILGDATAGVGDPSGRDATRPMLTREQIDQNAQGYLSQIGKIINIEKTEVRRNGEWFHAMQFTDVVRLLARGTVARMLERDNFTDRMKDGKAIHLHELLYPLMQGWDSVMVRADVELGGTDQLFNLMQGRQLQEDENQRPQIVMTMPILLGLDGRKMSKSYGNHIGVQFAAKEIFGRTMAMPDGELRAWFTLLTRIPNAQIDAMLAESKNPRDAKIALAKLLIEELHDKDAAAAEEANFIKQFSKGEIPEDIPIITLCADGRADALDITQPQFKADIASIKSGAVAFANFPALIAQLSGESSSNARQLMSQKAVELNGAPLHDPKSVVTVPTNSVLRVGKRKYFKIVIAG
ncbi:MAG: tyrosine--tRNA ligase [Planctomycetes bacterium]|nr:tyrosine--tRNA ligase [Planctomycetota bacterium]